VIVEQADTGVRINARRTWIGYPECLARVLTGVNVCAWRVWLVGVMHCFIDPQPSSRSYGLIFLLLPVSRESER
jgi:hypothetical protein